MNDVPQRYEVMTGQPAIEDGHILVPDRPGLGVDLGCTARNRVVRRTACWGMAPPLDVDGVYHAIISKAPHPVTVTHTACGRCRRLRHATTCRDAIMRISLVSVCRVPRMSLTVTAEASGLKPKNRQNGPASTSVLVSMRRFSSRDQRKRIRLHS